jgi:hypothetical protein
LATYWPRLQHRWYSYSFTLTLTPHTLKPLVSYPLPSTVFIITDKAKLEIVGEEVKGVGVMKDEEIKLEEIEASHTLGG